MTVDHINDKTIEAALDKHGGDPDHPDALTVADVRELLAHIQTDAEVGWADWMDGVEDGSAQVIADDGDTIVLDTGEEDLATMALDSYDGPLTVDDIAVRVVQTVHHRVAQDLAPEYNWGYTYPYVMAKPDGTEAGQRYVEAVVNDLQRRGCSPGQAWAYYGVEIRGKSQSAWGRRQGRDQSQVSKAYKKAKRNLP